MYTEFCLKSLSLKKCFVIIVYSQLFCIVHAMGHKLYVCSFPIYVLYNSKFDRMRFSMRNQCKKRKNRSPEVFPHEHYAVLVRVKLESHTVVQTPPLAWCPPQSGYPHFLLLCCRYPHHVVALVM